MDPGQLALLIPIIGVSIPVIAIWAGHQQKMAKIKMDATANATAEKAAQYAAQVAKLEDRVQVLERIVTDRGYDIATQIEALRDTRSVEESGAGVPLNMGKKELQS
ncbi:hypothetical protein CD351_13600 [Erythrobacter sp. KY5]|uniref:hypothetical protein n=1 Tax=Erythrobacter sp. KY5 TaxID=2011159 RepID=UPI000DBF1EDC|nr:hypothetical protein [Erythrobacter sp. KY5]AWW75466.1 hypothetical protein CD351_13600 [Erythrobacter sp. KY5]